MTGFSKTVRALILERDGGCALCGRQDRAIQIHHRSPRGMGGAKAEWVNQPANGVALCVDDHTFFESHRTHAENLGFIVRRGFFRPSDIAIKHHRYGVVFLDNKGGVRWRPDD